MNLISVIIPVYNAEKFIQICINSLLEQTYTNFEIICVDDGSKDNTAEILQEFAKQDARIRVYCQTNAGAAIARNKGIQESKGDYITFIDADDYVDNEYIQTLLSNIEENDVLITGYNKVTMYEHKLLYTVIPKDNEWAQFKYVSTCAKLYKSSFLKYNDLLFESFSVAEDVYFNLHCFTTVGVKVKVLSYAGYNYCLNEKSVTQDLKVIKTNNNNKLLNVLGKIYNNFDFSEFSPELVSYFFLKTVVQYILMQARLYSQKDLKEEYKKGFSFLKENNLFNFYNNKFEDWKINFCVLVFFISDKLKLMDLLLFVLRQIKIQII